MLRCFIINIYYTKRSTFSSNLWRMSGTAEWVELNAKALCHLPEKALLFRTCYMLWNTLFLPLQSGMQNVRHKINVRINLNARFRQYFSPKYSVVLKTNWLNSSSGSSTKNLSKILHEFGISEIEMSKFVLICYNDLP